MKLTRFIQLTDIHLFNDATRKLVGINTARSFQAVLKQIVKSRHWPPDFILLTGDLAQDDALQTYKKIQRSLARLNVPVYALPGNHDDQRKLKKVFNAPGHLVRGRWLFVFMDSNIPRKTGGRFRSRELRRMKKLLKTHRHLHALISFHHQPVPVGSKWLDKMKIINGKEFLGAIDECANVRGILWGHVHQAFDGWRKKVRFMATPSTSVQFKPKCSNFALESKAPGYRWLVLKEDGNIQTGVKRVKGAAFIPDFTATGY